MNCEQAENLISARLDGELPGDDPAALALDAHLAACAGCRAAAEAMQVQDAALVRAFAPARQSAQDVAERAMAAMLGGQTAPLPPLSLAYARVPPARLRIARLAAAAVAAGVVLGAVTLGLRLWRSGAPQVAATITPAPLPVAPPATQPVWQVALSTADVFSCPSHKTDEWQPLAAGAALAGGDRVRTGPAARVELVLADGSQVRLNGGTEARLDDARCVELKQGQLWSAVPEDAQPLRVVAPPAEGGTVSAVNPPGSRLDFACAPAGSVLTALHGPARLTDRRGAEVQVPAGTAMTLVNGLPSGRSSPGDVLLATGWLDDLLVLKGRDDPELTARVNELLARINLESAAATRPAAAAASAPGPVEQLIRAQGDRWCEPLACHVQSPASQADRATRLTAARLLADLAPPSAIPDLIALVGDRDGDVRFYAARALHRLTGQNFGRTPAQCATDSADSVEQTRKKWQAWWEQKKARYGKPEGGT